MYRNIRTDNPGIQVHITYRHNNGTVVLRGYAVSAQTGIRTDGSATKRRTAQSEAAVPAAERHLISAVMASLPRAATRPKNEGTKKKAEVDSPLGQAFATLKQAPGTLETRWNNAVLRRWMEYYERNVLPQMDDLMLHEGISEGEDIYDILRQSLTEKVRKNGRSKGCDRGIRDTVDGNLSAAQIIYDACRRIEPTLPAIRLARPRRIRCQKEQCKSLPWDVRRNLAQELRIRIKTEPLYVIGAVMMWDAGARTAEAAAVIPGVDISSDNVSYILWQEKEGVRSPVLKSSNAYRCVPLSYWGACMIRACLQHVAPEQYADKKYAPIKSQNLSKWVASRLSECGLNSAFVERAREEESRHPDKDADGTPIFDVAAYILRRDCASRWRNVCGLTPPECDYLLGHADKTAKKKRVDYTSRAEQRKLAQKLERYVYDPEMSAHPAIQPVGVEHGLDYDFVEFEKYEIQNRTEEVMILKLDLQAAENAENITLLLSRDVEIRETYRRSLKTHGTRNDAPIIGSGQIERGVLGE